MLGASEICKFGQGHPAVEMRLGNRRHHPRRRRHATDSQDDNLNNNRSAILSHL